MVLRNFCFPYKDVEVYGEGVWCGGVVVVIMVVFVLTAVKLIKVCGAGVVVVVVMVVVELVVELVVKMMMYLYCAPAHDE